MSDECGRCVYLMKLTYYQAKEGNFGDDLNAWLWPRIFPRIYEGSQEVAFIGIGSILGGKIAPNASRRIVFGTGIRRPRSVPVLNSDWDVRFVRGPISASALGLQRSEFVSDGAICLGLLQWPLTTKMYKIGFIPHFHFVKDYPSILSLGDDVHVIDPRGKVEDVISAIRSCERIITESLHGAILAEIFRVPWARVALYSWQTESADVSTLKWMDWALSHALDGSAVFSAAIPVYSHRLAKIRRNFVLPWVRAKVIAGISEIARKGLYTQGTDLMLNRRLNQAYNAVKALSEDYALGCPDSVRLR